MPTKGDQFYGYTTIWEGYPFSNPQELPISYGSCTTDGNHAAHTTVINIDPLKTVPPIAAGDTVVFNSIAYLILFYQANKIEIEPPLMADVFNGTIGNVLPSAIPPTTFDVVDEIVPKIKLVSSNIGEYIEGATQINITVTQGLPEIGQILIVGGDLSEIQYMIVDVMEIAHPEYLVTIAAPGLLFRLEPGVYMTQTRNQKVAIENRVGEIFENEYVRLGNYSYSISAYEDDPNEAIILATPGVLEVVVAHTTGTIYH